MRQSFISFSYISTWKAEIDYCKQIEMPETKDTQDRRGGDNLRMQKKLNSPIFKPDFLPCAHNTHTHHYLVSHIKSQFIPVDALWRWKVMRSYSPFFLISIELHIAYRKICLALPSLSLISIKHTMTEMAGPLVLRYSDSVTDSWWSYLALIPPSFPGAFSFNIFHISFAFPASNIW